MDNRFEQAYKFYKGKGYSDLVARAMAGNAGHESSFNSRAVNPTSKMEGYFQWDTVRRGRLKKFAQDNGVDPYDFNTQLQFSDWELNNTHKYALNKINQATNINEASDAVQNYYEVAPGQGTERRRFISTFGRFPKNKAELNSWAKTKNNSHSPTPIKQYDNGITSYKEEEFSTNQTDWPTTKPITTSHGLSNTFTTMGNKVKNKLTSIKTSNNFTSIAPYISNLYNATVKPGKVPMPIMNNAPKYDLVNYDSDRNAVSKDYRASMQNADLTLDPQSSVAAKMMAKAAKFQQLSAINQAERNANTDIRNKQTEANVATAASNNAKLDLYRQQNLERDNWIKSFKSANLANAADKFVQMKNVQDQNDLEREKFGYLTKSDYLGTLKRLVGDERTEKKFGGYTTKRLYKVINK